MNAVMLVAQAIVEPGDNVVCVTPSWPNILRAITITGGEAREVALDHDDSGWHLDLQRLFDACDGRTRAIYYASPGNPTGWMLEDAQQRELLAWARGRGIAIIADEVYQRIVYDRPTRRPSWKSPRRTTRVRGQQLLKSWAMTGWRMGWLIYPRGMVDTFEKLIQFNTSGGQAFLQAGGVVALNEGEAFVRSLRRALPRRPRHRAGPAGGAGSRAHRAQQGVLLRDVRRGRHRRLAGVLQARRA